jgi:superfamily II DNA or RNA helicase
MHSIVSDIVREAKNKKSCIVFCSEKEHCEAIAKELEKHILAKKIQLYYGDSKQTKEEMKRRAENKKDILVTIATFSIATEGTNVKAWERIFFGFSVGNEKDLVQAIGRGRRVLKGKDDLVVYDYRFPFVRGLENHGRKRDFVYRKYGFKISYINESTSIITRGWAI